MSNDLKDLKLEDIMPANLLDDERVLQACRAIDTELQKISAAWNIPAIIDGIDTASEEVLDLLAWQWHVDFYDDDLTVDQKRKMIKTSIAWHRKKGTKQAVQDMASIVYPEGKVQEWFEYGAEPYHFRISLRDAPMNLDEIVRVIKLVKEAKNARSWLDKITFEKNIDCKYHVGCMECLYKVVDIMPVTVSDENLDGKFDMGEATHIHKSVDIGPATVADTDIEALIRAAMQVNDYKQIEIGPAAVEDTSVNANMEIAMHALAFKKSSITQIGYKEE